MADDEQKTPPSEKNAEDPGGLEETTGQIEDDATRQITGDALQQIRESAGHDMAPEWLEKMRERKREAEKREDEDFDTPVPDAIQADGTPATAQMDPDEVGSLTAGMGMPTEDSGVNLREGPKDSDTTELERDATKAINRGELDTLMKEREAEEVGEEDSNATSERPAPGAGVISKASREVTDRPTRDVNDDASAAVAEADAEQEEKSSSSSFSLPKPGSKAKKEPSDQPEDGLDEDSFGDFSDEDLHAVVFGEGEEGEESPAAPEDSGDEKPADNARVEESPALDFSDISADDEDEAVELAADDDEAVEPTADDTIDDQPQAEDEQSETDAPELEPPDLSIGDDDVEEAGEEPGLAGEDADELGVSDDADVEPPEEFPDYDQGTKRPAVAAAAGFLAALVWIVGGALAMFTSLPSPWESMVPPIALGAGIVAFLLVLVGPPKWIEASILAALGIGIGGFAFVQWSNIGSINVSDYLGMAPLVGGGLAIVAAIMTLIRPAGRIEDL